MPSEQPVDLQAELNRARAAVRAAARVTRAVQADLVHAGTLSKSDSLTLFEQDISTGGIPIFIVGIPVMLDVTLTPSMTVDYEVALDGGQLYGHVEPALALDATVEAYVDYWLVEAKAGGTAQLLEVRPKLTGAVYFDNDQIEATLGGEVKVSFLQGGPTIFLDIGTWPLETHAKWKLFEYPGYSNTIPVFDLNGTWK